MLKYIKDHRNSAFIIFSFLYWISAGSIVDFYQDLSTQRAIEDQKSLLQSEVAQVRANIESSIYEDIYIADALAMVIEYDNDIIQKDWEKLAEQLIQKSQFIRNLTVAPNNIITHIYPLKGNEAAIGVDFKTIPSQYKAVQKAKAIQSVYLDGPLELIQGGVALIARFPIFLDYPSNFQYWGSVSTVIDYDKLLNVSGIHNVLHGELSLKRINLLDEDNVFYGKPEIFNNPHTIQPINLPNNHWLIAAKLNETALMVQSEAKQTSTLFGTIAALSLYLSFCVLFRSYIIAHKASNIDHLTQLPNRRHFFKQLRLRIKRAKHAGNFAILNIDVNDFKYINDSQGHEAGDAVLNYLAKQLSSVLTENDVLARMGGDEFLVLLNKATNKTDLENVIASLHAHIKEQPFKWNNAVFNIQLSIGSAIYHDHSEESLLSEADRKMYQDKLNQKNQIHDYTI